MLMTYLTSYVLYLIHLMYFYLMLGRVMLTCDSFALVGGPPRLKADYGSNSVILFHVVLLIRQNHSI